MSTDGGAPTGRAARRKPGRPRLDGPSESYLQRLAAIVHTAAQVFQDHGYEAASLDQIAEGLELRKASLYYYVGSKAELLRMVFDHTLTLALERFEEIQAIADPRERLRALIEHQVYTLVEYPTYYAVFFDQRAHLSPEHSAMLREKEQAYLHVYRKAVTDAIDAGVLPAVDSWLGAQAILGMTSWIYKWFRPGIHDPEQFAETCVRLVMGTDDS